MSVRWLNILHWMAITLFLLTVFSAATNTTFYSKEAIMESFSVSLPAVGADIAPVDQLFMARLVRRELWEFHFFTGIFLFATTLCMVFFTKRPLRRKLMVSFAIVMFLMFCTGVFLYSRDIVEFSELFMQIARTSHFILSFVAFGLVAVHAVLSINSNPCSIGKRFVLFKKAKDA